jgi:GT2 family glycosyltransferase
MSGTAAPASVSAVIVSYNTRDRTLDCLARLLMQPVNVPFEVVVVDNASSDGSAAAIERAFPQVRVMCLPENVGFGRAINRAASTISSDFLMLLNPDAEAVGPIVDNFVEAATQTPGHGIYAGRSLRADGSDDGYSVRGVPTLWSLFAAASGLRSLLPSVRWANPEGLPHLDRKQAHVVQAVSGCVLLIDRDLFTDIDGFDPQYFMYCEDTDFSVRARAAGARPLLCPSVKVIHDIGGSSGSVRQKVMLLRGKITFIKRHWSRPRATIGTALMKLEIAMRALAGRLGFGSSDWPAVWRDRATWCDGWPALDEPRVRV